MDGPLELCDISILRPGTKTCKQPLEELVEYSDSRENFHMKTKCVDNRSQDLRIARIHSHFQNIGQHREIFNTFQDFSHKLEFTKCNCILVDDLFVLPISL